MKNVLHKGETVLLNWKRDTKIKIILLILVMHIKKRIGSPQLCIG